MNTYWPAFRFRDAARVGARRVPQASPLTSRRPPLRPAAANRATLPDEKTVSPRMVWRFNHKLRSMPAGKLLRIETLAPAVIRWSADDWNTIHDVTAHDSGMGIHIADLPTKAIPEGNHNQIYFHWPEADRWEGKDFIVQVDSGRGDQLASAQRSKTMHDRASTGTDANRFVYLATAISALGGMLFAMTLVSSPGHPVYQKGILAFRPGWKKSSSAQSCWIANRRSGRRSPRRPLGRRRLLIVTAIVFGLGAIGPPWRRARHRSLPHGCCRRRHRHRFVCRTALHFRDRSGCHPWKARFDQSSRTHQRHRNLLLH